MNFVWMNARDPHCSFFFTLLLNSLSPSHYSLNIYPLFSLFFMTWLRT